MKHSETTTEIRSSLFIQKHSVAIRIWHWSTFIVMSFSMITVLFASTLLDPKGNIGEVQSQLKEKGAIVTEDQAWAVTHAFEDKMWDLHKFLGYALSLLLLARIVIEFTQTKEEKLQTKIKSALQLYKRKGHDFKESKHYLIVKWSYVLFFVLLLFMAVTGLLLAFGFELGLPRETHHLIKEIHGFGQYLIYTFVFFHIAGVVIADLGKSIGIVSGMINGGE
jgi:Ni/Fe-hydrogenase 1 B-type cytochrome subunit